MPRLGVNIDHIATLRNARGENYPDIVRGANEAAKGGADGITVHLREDRRHIRDADVYLLKEKITLPINMEMAATEEMLKIALDVKPNAVCIVPEHRKELTTEGGLDVGSMAELLMPMIDRLHEQNIRVSLFVDADENQIRNSAIVGADIVELHTGAYSNGVEGELEKIKSGAKLADSLGTEVHAGHGLNYDNVGEIAAIEEVKELNIGHFLIGEAVFASLANSIERMKKIITGVVDY